MTPQDRFVRAVLSSPQADEVRHRFADWLDESLDPLGEFIRVQCRLARGKESWQCQHELERRERELLAEFEGAWAAPIKPFVDYWVFHRGFIEEIALSAEAFLAHSSLLFRLAPIQIVHINGLGNAHSALASCPDLTKVRFLDLSANRLGDSGLRMLTQSPYLAGNRGLNLSYCSIGDPGIQALVNSPNVALLRELYLDFNNISDEGADALAESSNLENLASLYIAWNNISRRGQDRLVQRFGYRVRPCGSRMSPRREALHAASVHV